MASGADAGAVVLDLIPPELVRPRLRKAAAVIVIAMLLVVVALGQFVAWPFAVLIPLAVLGPVLFGLVTGIRRSTTITGSVITARAGTTRKVDLDIADEVTVSVRRGRVTQVSLHADRVHIALAIYMGEGGRELDIQAMKALSDALAERAPEISELLVGQLRAEAIGAGLAQRPLHKATAFVEGGHKAVTLSPEQLASLLD